MSSFLRSVLLARSARSRTRRPGAIVGPLMDVSLPPCGLYRTTGAIGSVPAGRLVYFHNHGDPGPGVYLPESWSGNRARFGRTGVVLDDPGAVRFLAPLPAEGFYRVKEAFFCCEQRCRRYEADALVQLGYDASATPIVFVPEITEKAIELPERGTRIDAAAFAHLAALRVSVRTAPGETPTVH